jgi:hypothetical protein
MASSCSYALGAEKHVEILTAVERGRAAALAFDRPTTQGVSSIIDDYMIADARGAR